MSPPSVLSLNLLADRAVLPYSYRLYFDDQECTKTFDIVAPITL